MYWQRNSHITHTCPASASKGMRYLVCRKAALRRRRAVRRAVRRVEGRVEGGLRRRMVSFGTFLC